MVDGKNGYGGVVSCRVASRRCCLHQSRVLIGWVRRHSVQRVGMRRARSSGKNSPGAKATFTNLLQAGLLKFLLF